jgi:NADH-quinone oxidoreductase subunit J
MESLGLSFQQIVFIVIGSFTLVTAIMVVASPRILHAALWLILSLAGTAVLFLLLGSGLFAVIQVAVYIDAIAVLIIITVMLTRRSMRDTDPQWNRNWILAALAAVGLFVSLSTFLLLTSDQAAATLEPLADSGEIIAQLGKALVDVDQFIIPFEVASVLLLAAVIGAIVVARVPLRRSDEGGEN